MVEFRFDIKPLFPQPIIKITSNLLPHTFRGDRRMALDTTSKMSEIIDRLGELSASSQKLSKAVTSAQRLRMSDNQKIYLLADAEAGHKNELFKDMSSFGIPTKPVRICTMAMDKSHCSVRRTPPSHFMSKKEKENMPSKSLLPPVVLPPETMMKLLASVKCQLAHFLRPRVCLEILKKRCGAVIGLLKVGTKSLYLFDESGETKKVDDTPCILDFYIHESRQRAGLGKDLFETMLAEENWSPIKLSIDRPSEKLLGFLKKHYGMEKTIPQSNNFVLYEGFFGPPSTENNNQRHANGLHITDSPNTALFGPHFIGDDHKKRIRHQDTPSPSTQITQISPVGRYAAPRPTCSMAEAMKRESEISLTPSEVLRHEKLNSLKKNPLDAITRPPKINEFQEKRSGLQNVNEDNFKNYYSSPFSQKNSGLSPPGPRASNTNTGLNITKSDNSATNDALKTVEIESKAAPSEPKFEDNSTALNQDETGFCTTCPNCSAKILLMPESETKAEDSPLAQIPS